MPDYKDICRSLYLIPLLLLSTVSVFQRDGGVGSAIAVQAKWTKTPLVTRVGELTQFVSDREALSQSDALQLSGCLISCDTDSPYFLHCLFEESAKSSYPFRTVSEGLLLIQEALSEGRANATCAFVATEFEHMYSNALFCGARAIDLTANATHDRYLIALSLRDIEEKASLVDAVVGRVARHCAQLSPKQLPIGRIGFVVDISDCDQAKVKSLQKLASAFLVSKTAAAVENYATKNLFAIDSHSIFFVNCSSLPSLRSTSSAVRQFFASTATTDRDSRSVRALRSVLSHWKSSASTDRESPPKMIFSKSDSQAFLELEAAQTECVKLIESSAAQWQRRLNSGRAVAQLGAQLAQLAQLSMRLFLSSTRGNALAKQRASSASQLVQYLQTTAASLVAQQLRLLELDAQAQLKARMRPLAPIPAMPQDSAEDQPGEGDSNAAAAASDATLLQRRREAASVFAQCERQLRELQWSEGGVRLDEEVLRGINETLFSTADAFPQSLEGRLESAKKLEREMKRRALLGAAGGPMSRGRGKGRQLRAYMSSSSSSDTDSDAEDSYDADAHAQLHNSSSTAIRALRRFAWAMSPSRLQRSCRRLLQRSLSPISSLLLPGRGGSSGGFSWSCAVGLQLVGMLRPPGFGNLQGFVGWHTALLGMPLELLFGLHNDGDSPEVLGDDREHPLLRLQPKLHFEVTRKQQSSR